MFIIRRGLVGAKGSIYSRQQVCWSLCHSVLMSIAVTIVSCAVLCCIIVVVRGKM